MPQDDQTNNDSSETNKKDDSASHATVRAKSFGLRWIIIGGCVASLALLFISIYLPNLTERVKFFTVNFLSLLVLIIILVQALIYRRQWGAMDTQAGTMQEQLKAMKAQEGVMTGQLATMKESLSQNARLTIASEAQRDAMQGQLVAIEKQAKIMEESLNETRELVKHSEVSIQAAERNTRYAQRAYVTVTKREAIETGFNLTIENSGNTPAIDVALRITTDLGFTPPKLPEGVNLEGFISIGVLAPRDSYEMFISFGRGVTEEEKEWFDDPKLGFNWWCVGSINYKDIFQTNIFDYRQTDFAFYEDRVRRKVQAWVDGDEIKEHYTT